MNIDSTAGQSRARRLAGTTTRWLLAIGNAVVVGRYLLLSLWILFGGRQEVLTGERHEWPVGVLVVAAVACVAASSLLVSMIRLRRHPASGRIGIVASLLVLSTLELLESTMLVAEYGMPGPGEWDVVAFGPALLGWALLNGWGLRGPRRTAQS